MLTFWSLILSILAVSSAQTIEIKLKPLSTITDPDLLFFEPYFPEPSEPTSCSEETSFGETETVCGGTFPLDLASGKVLSFQWDASSNGDKFISITGEGEARTRIEFQATIENCEAESSPQDGTDITVTLNKEGIDAPQKYNFDTDGSFVELGPCEIFTRMQFNPDDNGDLDMKFNSITFSVNYDPQQLPGETAYKWGTDFYTWIRKPEEGAIELLDKAPVSTPSPTPSPTTPSPTPSPTTPSPTPSPTTPSPTPSPTTSGGYFIGNKGFDLVSSIIFGACVYLLSV